MATVNYNLNGSELTFQLHPVGTSFRQFAGIYLFLKPRNDGKWNVLYVGESSDINQRLNTAFQSHQARACAVNKGLTHFGIMTTTGGQQGRISLETRLRHAIKLPCNKQ